MEAALMSKTLNLTDQLLSRGRFLQEIGRTHDAARLLGRLAGLRELPAAAAEETQARLAELNIRQRHFPQARRHLAAALTHNTKNARYHYLMAVAHDQDENGDPQTALDHFRQALRLDADQPRYLGDFGILALCLGHNEEGLAALRRGVDLAPDDPEAVGKLVEGLCLAEQPAEARLALRSALFRNPRHAGFRKLWNDFQFEQLCEEQEAARRRQQNRLDDEEEPVFLPFSRTAAEAVPVKPSRRRIRHDGPSTPTPPHTPRRIDLPTRRHA
ncbi:MAG: tetratricopeptide repeat protein [Planctomycetota bacterium]|nr:MAG: tetratricopeptide repeat protein [Planctomycetota bacterium]